MSFEVRRLSGFGAEILNLDLSQELAPETALQLYELWLEHGILVFRNGPATAEQQIRLAKCFGTLQEHPVKHIRVENNPDLIFLGGEGDSIPVHFVDDVPRRGFLYWHSDMTYVPDISKGSLLRMAEPPSAGGRTSWVDTAGAYDALPPSTKALIADLAVVHTSRSTPERAWGNPDMRIRRASAEEYAGPVTEQTFPPVLHPLVISHQETGRKSLLLSPLSFVKVEGMPEPEGEALYETLVQHALRPQHRYTHRWSAGDMVLWDNRRTMHFAEGYPPDDRRVVIRATLAEVQTTGRLY